MASQDPSPIHKNGYCVWFGHCTTGPKARICAYNKPAKNVTDPQAEKIIEELCPELRGGPTCCDYKQLKTLADNVQVLKQITGRCPACWDNLRRLYCSTTCSPDQSLYMDSKLIRVKKWVEKVAVYVSQDYKRGLFDACKDVIFPGNNEKILNLLCGRTAEKCTPQLLLDFLGNPANGMAPFEMQYPQIIPENLTWFDLEPRKCNVSFIDPVTTRTTEPCSCQDCKSSCPVIPPYIPPPPPKHYLGLTLVPFCCLVIFIAFLLFWIPCNLCIACRRSRTTSYLFAPQAVPSYSGNASATGANAIEIRRKTGICEQLGCKIEMELKKFFTWWGTWCGCHPWTVMVGSLVVVIALCLGVYAPGLKITTDPVELWSAPESRARKEKDIFDTKFNPFYRTEQIIINAKPQFNKTGYHQSPDKKFIPFGRIFHKELLNEVVFKINQDSSHRKTNKNYYNMKFDFSLTCSLLGTQ